MIKKTLAILAGGKGSRMNYKNKALLSFKDKAFIEYIIEAGKDFDEIIIVANNTKDYEKYNLKIVKDIYKEKGPLGGIHSALIHSKFDEVFCVACDMPLINKETLNKIVRIKSGYDILVPKVNDRIQPLCGIYSKKIIKKIEEKLEKNENKMQQLIFEQNYKIIEDNFSINSFININTNIEYDNLEENNVYSRDYNK